VHAAEDATRAFAEDMSWTSHWRRVPWFTRVCLALSGVFSVASFILAAWGSSGAEQHRAFWARSPTKRLCTPACESSLDTFPPPVMPVDEYVSWSMSIRPAMPACFEAVAEENFGLTESEAAYLVPGVGNTSHWSYYSNAGEGVQAFWELKCGMGMRAGSAALTLLQSLSLFHRIDRFAPEWSTSHYLFGILVVVGEVFGSFAAGITSLVVPTGGNQAPVHWFTLALALVGMACVAGGVWILVSLEGVYLARGWTKLHFLIAVYPDEADKYLEARVAAAAWDTVPWNVLAHDGATPLLVAIHHERVPIVRRLLAAGRTDPLLFRPGRGTFSAPPLLFATNRVTNKRTPQMSTIVRMLYADTRIDPDGTVRDRVLQLLRDDTDEDGACWHLSLVQELTALHLHTRVDGEGALTGASAPEHAKQLAEEEGSTVSPLSGVTVPI
jgi:hypothetical protein